MARITNADPLNRLFDRLSLLVAMAGAVTITLGGEWFGVGLGLILSGLAGTLVAKLLFGKEDDGRGDPSPASSPPISRQRPAEGYNTSIQFTNLPTTTAPSGAPVQALIGDKIAILRSELTPLTPVTNMRHSEEQMGAIVVGRVKIKIGEDVREYGPGETYVIPSDTLHDFHALTDSAVVLDAFSPIPDFVKKLLKDSQILGRSP